MGAKFVILHVRAPLLGACSPSPWRERRLAGSPCPGDQQSSVLHLISPLLHYIIILTFYLWLDSEACSPSPWRARQLAGSPCPGDQRCSVLHLISPLLDCIVILIE